jgi:phage replication O-like protein O
VASPELSNGFTPISNELLEAIIRASLSARELRIVLAVARLTYGWRRKATTISAYRLAAMTGIGRTKVAQALRTLKGRNILSNGSAGLGLQKNYEAWSIGSKLNRVRTGPGPDRPGSEPDRKIGSEPDPVIGSEPDPHQIKKTRKQEIATAMPSLHRSVIEEYVRLFTEKFGTPPVIVGGRDGRLVKDLLRARTLALGDVAKAVDEIRALMAGFFRVGTRWVRENGAYTLPMFKAAYNELLVMCQRGEL